MYTSTGKQNNIFMWWNHLYFIKIKILIHVATWMIFEDIIWSIISQKNGQNCVFFYISTTIHTNVTENIKLNQENSNNQTDL